MPREPDGDDHLPGAGRSRELAVEDLTAGDPELLLPDAAEQVQAFAAQDDALHLDVAAPCAAVVVVRAVGPHGRRPYPRSRPSGKPRRVIAHHPGHTQADPSGAGS